MNVERIEQWIGQDVIDVDGEKVGRLEEVYHRGDVAALAEIKPSRLGRKRLLASLDGASAARDWLRLGVRSEEVHEETTSGAGPAQEDLDAAAAVSGAAPVSCDELESSTARAARLAEADAARARAEELEAEAARQAQTADNFASQAAMAGEEAEAAERARQRAEAEAADARRAADEAQRRV